MRKIINKLGETKNGLSKSSSKAAFWRERPRPFLCRMRNRNQRASLPTDQARRQHLWQNILPGVQPGAAQELRRWRKRRIRRWPKRRPVLIGIKSNPPFIRGLFFWKKWQLIWNCNILSKKGLILSLRGSPPEADKLRDRGNLGIASLRSQWQQD